MSKTDHESKHVDAQTLNRKQRIRAIHQARQRVHEKVNDSYDAMASEAVDRTLANTIVRKAVEQYIMEIEALVKSDDERKKTYWEEYQLGSMDMPTQVVEFRGLESIVDAPEFISDEWEETVVNDVTGKETETRAVQQQISMDVLMAAYRAANAFCADVGLDIDVQEAQEFEFEYSDIVDE